MKADKNTIIGFVLLGILFFVYFWYTGKQQSALQAAEKRAQDSIAAVNAAKAKSIDPNAIRPATPAKARAFARPNAGFDKRDDATATKTTCN